MTKRAIQRLFNRARLQLVSTTRWGVQCEVDVNKLQCDHPVETVLDVGANVGQTATAYHDAFPQAAIHSFEPVPAVFEELKRRVASLSRVRAYCLALGASAGNMRIAMSDSDLHSTLSARGAGERSIEIQVDTLDAVCERLGLSRIDLLKLDVEGYELEVLAGAIEMLKRNAIRLIVAECEFASSPALTHTSFFDLHQRLAPWGFKLVTFYTDWFDPVHHACMGNALYICTNSYLSDGHF